MSLFRSRFGAACVAAAATATVMVGSAWAATPTAPAVIRACENPSNGDLHARLNGKCSAGYTGSLSWNVQGPRGPAGAQGLAGPQGPAGAPGPAGASYGLANYGGTATSLNPAFTQKAVLSTPNAQVAGKYFVSASVTVFIAQGDTVACVIGGAPSGIPTVGPAAASSYQTLPLEGVVQLDAGESTAVYCLSYNATTGTAYNGGTIDAILVDNTTSGAPRGM